MLIEWKLSFIFFHYTPHEKYAFFRKYINDATGRPKEAKIVHNNTDLFFVIPNSQSNNQNLNYLFNITNNI